ncbi:hypothetical protein SO802_003355 [Lithocarpus litseifolius]|uniref:Uncharacterized protein n=1 Tax=Lithocarpus litseifolius TaxID=425828 RepID=A0AAW2E0S8_9ROSI
MPVNRVLLLFLAEAEPDELELELEVSAPLATEPRVLSRERLVRPDRARRNRACSRRNSRCGEIVAVGGASPSEIIAVGEEFALSGGNRSEFVCVLWG